jgi:hypothetical protein
MTDSARWNRLVQTLAEGGIPVRVHKNAENSRSIMKQHGSDLVWVTDAWWGAQWLGWQVWIENSESIVQKSYPRTKKRGVVLSQLREATREPMIPGLDVTVEQAEAYAESVRAPVSAPKRQPQGTTSKHSAGSSQTSSDRPRRLTADPMTSSADAPTGASRSHAYCSHEATKSARAKCRAERKRI